MRKKKKKQNKDGGEEHSREGDREVELRIGQVI